MKNITESCLNEVANLTLRHFDSFFERARSILTTKVYLQSNKLPNGPHLLYFARLLSRDQ